MATQITEPATVGPGLTDWTNFIDRTTKQGRGYFGVTFSNLDSGSESKPQAGSIIENNGSFFQSASEESPTGWSSISNSTQAYMYMSSAGAYSYSTSAPTFSTSKNGWYSGTSRAVLKVYKDSSGNYTKKGIYVNTKYIADDIYIENDLTVGNDAEIGGSMTLGDGLDLGSTGGLDVATNTRYLHGTYTLGDIYDALAPFFTADDQELLVNGMYGTYSSPSITMYQVTRVKRVNSTTLKIYHLLFQAIYTTAGSLGGTIVDTTDTNITTASSTSYEVSLSW